MKLSRILIPILLLAAACSPGAAAQSPVPPAVPSPPLPGEPAIAPVAPLPPDLADRMSDMTDRLMTLQDRLGDTNFNFNVDFDTKALTDRIKASAKEMAFQVAVEAPRAIMDRYVPFAFAPQHGRMASDDRLYDEGQRALDNHRYADALADFNQVTARGGARADGASYWKAYTLIKLGRRDEALAAIAELRKSYPNSRWLDDAKALEVQAGKPVSPESESDEELKLIALNGLMQSDPDRALPLLENLLKGNQPPNLKKRVVYVLAASNSPKAQQLLEQVARGGQGNPDLQLFAIRYLGERRNQPARTQLLAEIYATSSDVNIKRTIINSFGSLSSSGGGADKLAEIVRTEKDPKLRAYAIQILGSQRAAGTGDMLAAMYATEQDPEVKSAIIDSLTGQRNAKALVSVARAEKDSKMKQRIVERLAGMKSPEATDYLMEILK